MKLELDHKELTDLVREKVSALGFKGELTIEFQARRGGLIDTVIEIGSKNQGHLELDDAENITAKEIANNDAQNEMEKQIPRQY